MTEFLPDSTTDYRVSCPCMSKNKCIHVFSIAVDVRLFKLADKEEIHDILYVFEFLARLEDRQQSFFTFPCTSERYPHWVIMGKTISTVFLDCLLT